MQTTITIKHPSELDEETLSAAKALFDAHGFLKIENLFSKDFIEHLATCLLATLQSDSDTMTLEQGAKIHRGRYIVPIPFSPPFNQPALYANPVLFTLMKALLGSDCVLSGLGAVVSLPGAPDQHIHSDFEPLFPDQPNLRGLVPPYAITVAIPLVDIDVLNGPTKIWSGTHRAASVDKVKIDDFYARHLLCGSMGSCYFWDYRTFHAGGSNHSDAMRPLLYLAYTRRWFRDLKNPDKLVLEEKDRNLIPEEARSLFPSSSYWTAETERAFRAELDALLRKLTLF